MVLDWQDRITGQVWRRWPLGARSPQRHYYRRGQHLDLLDPDVVAVRIGTNGVVYFVHDTEIGETVP